MKSRSQAEYFQIQMIWQLLGVEWLSLEAAYSRLCQRDVMIIAPLRSPRISFDNVSMFIGIKDM